MAIGTNATRERFGIVKILHVITELWAPAGTTKFVVGMANAMSRKGDDVTIAIRDLNFPEQTMPSNAVKVVTIGDVLSGERRENWDLIHIHGLWNYRLHKMSIFAKRTNVPVVWSPHGMLTSTAMHFKRWKKVIPWHVYQKNDCSSAALWHATTEKEVQDIRRCGFSQPCVVCPLGVDMPMIASGTDRHTKTILFLSRVHKTKGVENLILAWSGIQHADWTLTIAGPCEETFKRQLDLLAGKDGSIEFLGPVYGDEKKQLYQGCEVFVLPTFTENFGVVVAEALAFGKPVITTYGAPWQVLKEINAGYWIPIGVEPLKDALLKMMSLTDNERWEMGARGRRYVEQQYSWRPLSERMRKGYSKILQ